VAVNSTIDFLLVTDQEMSNFHIPSNLEVRNCLFKDMQNLIHRKIGDWCVLDRPYKLADYKPTYGLLFEEDLVNYDWFGWCDTDMILGDLRRFLTKDRLNQTDKIGEGGMFVLMRNNDDCKNYFAKEYPTWHVNYREAFSSKASFQFDETDFMNRVFDLYHDQPHDTLYGEIGDTRPKNFDFTNAKAPSIGKELYRYQNGRVFRIGKNGYSEEMMWVHLLKRQMTIFSPFNPRNYWILPNGFVSSENECFYEDYQATTSEIKLYQARFNKINRKKWLSRLQNGWFYRKLRYIYRKNKRKIFDIKTK
jgi:hypothetical protein